MCTIHYGLIGKQLTHSASGIYFEQKFAKSGRQAKYALIELTDINAFEDWVRISNPFRGLNVTIPYKQAILRYVDWVHPAVLAIEAANTLKWDADFGWVAYNTDIIGAEADLQELLGGARPNNAMILGTGGAAQAVAYTLKEVWGIEELAFVSRTPAASSEISYADANARLADTPLLINATPVGMYPNVTARPTLAYDRLTAAHYCWDLIYNPKETAFLRACATQGAKTRNGWGMLTTQADASLHIWESPVNPREIVRNPHQAVSLLK